MKAWSRSSNLKMSTFEQLELLEVSWWVKLLLQMITSSMNKCSLTCYSEIDLGQKGFEHNFHLQFAACCCQMRSDSNNNKMSLFAYCKTMFTGNFQCLRQINQFAIENDENWCELTKMKSKEEVWNNCKMGKLWILQMKKFLVQDERCLERYHFCLSLRISQVSSKHLEG
jgi:hypothetical protein